MIIPSIHPYDVYHSNRIGHEEHVSKFDTSSRKFYCTMHKLLRRYGVDMYRLQGRENMVGQKYPIVMDFYNHLNRSIQVLFKEGYEHLFSEINDANCTCYALEIAYPLLSRGAERTLTIFTISDSGYKTVVEYKFNIYIEEEKKALFLYTIIINTIIRQINHYLDGYRLDKALLYPVIKRFLYALVKIDSDLSKYCVYKSHKRILRQFYCLNGLNFYKHFIMGTVPKTFRFYLNE